MGVNSDILREFKKSMKSWWQITREHRDYILMKEIYHCSPSELDNQDEFVLQLHFEFYMAEREEEYYQSKRNEMRSSNRKK